VRCCCAAAQPGGRPIESTSIVEALRPPVEPGQYTSVRFGETLSLSGLVPSIGSVGDAFDNALAETTIGLYKNEAVREDSPFRRGPLHRLADVELLTADWVHWYNTDRLMHRLGRIPPVEYEAVYYATNTAQSAAAHQ
jgi:putative transposase